MICLICNENFKAVTNTHLKNKHRMTAAQYKNLFPGEKLGESRPWGHAISGIGKPAWNTGLTKETDLRLKKCAKAISSTMIAEKTMAGKNNPMHGKKSWNNNLTKETDCRVAKNAYSIHLARSANPRKGEKATFYGRHHTEETKKIIREKNSIKQKANWENPSSIYHSPEYFDARAKIKPIYFDTKIEIAIQNVLRKNNISFETQKMILGHPDIFISPNICIFCDGDYFHANPKKYKANDIVCRSRTAKQVWDKDFHITKTLESKGYTVLRFWENDIEERIDECFSRIKDATNE